MNVKKMIKCTLSLLICLLLHACTAWDDTWDEVIPLPETDDTVIVEPWEKEENNI